MSIFDEFAEAFDYAIHFYDGVEYEKLTFGNDTFRIVLLFMWIGAIFAFCAMYYNNHYLGDFVQKLILSGAVDKSHALTLSELGLEKKLLLKYSLRSGSVLRKCVLAKDDPIPVSSEFYKGIGTPEKEDVTVENTPDTAAEAEISSNAEEGKPKRENINTLAFYIPEQLSKKAQTRYRKKGNGVFMLVISIVATGLFAFFAAVYGPLILRILDNAIASWSSNGTNYGR